MEYAKLLDQLTHRKQAESDLNAPREARATIEELLLSSKRREKAVQPQRIVAQSAVSVAPPIIDSASLDARVKDELIQRLTSCLAQYQEVSLTAGGQPSTHLPLPSRHYTVEDSLRVLHTAYGEKLDAAHRSIAHLQEELKFAQADSNTRDQTVASLKQRLLMEDDRNKQLELQNVSLINEKSRLEALVDVLKEGKAGDGRNGELATEAVLRKLLPDLHRQIAYGTHKVSELTQHNADLEAQVFALKARIKKSARRFTDKAELLRAAEAREAELRRIVTQLVPSLEALQSESHELRRSRGSWEASNLKKWEAERNALERDMAQLAKQSEAILSTARSQYTEQVQQLQATVQQLQKAKVDLQCEVSTLLRQRNTQAEDYEHMFAQRGHVPHGGRNFNINDLAWKGIVSRVLVS